MRVFLVFCLCATAYAVPQGYNYQQQQQQQQHQQQQQQQPQQQSAAAFQVPNLSFIHEAFKKPNLQSQHSQAQQFSATPQFSNNKPLQQIQPQQQSFGYANLPQQQQVQQQQQQQPSLPLGFGGQQQFQSQQQFPPQYQPQRYQAPAPITKDIYVHVAPDEPEQAQYQQQLPPVPPRKHYRIVFIKAPTPKINSAALRISQAPVEEKTIIYVLTKKPDPLDFQAAIQEAHPKQPSKPEVYFIKYKTQEEAQHAQRTIQAQYDQLGGTTQVSDEGIAPVTSVIGSLDGQQSRGGVSSQSFSSSSPSFSPSSASSSSLPLALASSSSSSSSSSSLSGASNPNASNYLPPIVKL